jgi:ElaB/YqjD/DUF883 family membrane-anchored ribosome-binding protein
VAQERNEVGAPNAADTEEIRSEIERTRVEMSETLGEIQDRLRPDHLMQQARDGVTQAASEKARSIMTSAGETAATVADQARGVGGSLASYVREHPVQVALTVGALAWWIMRNRDRSDDWYGSSDTSWDDSEATSYDNGGTLRTRMGDYASTARDTVGEYASTARETVGEYASTARETVGEYAMSARERARRASESARRAASTATNNMDNYVHENPLVAGVIALAAGTVIGMSVPATELENRTMGEARDRALDRASQAATELKVTVTTKVQNAAETFVNENAANMAGGSGSSPEPMGRA